MFSFQIVPVNDVFRLLEINLLGVDGTCHKNTCRAHVFLILILSACLSSLLSQLSKYTQPHCHALTPHTRVAHGKHCVCLAQNRLASLYVTPPGHRASTFQPASTLCRSTTSYEWRFLAEPHPSQVMTPSGLLNTRIYVSTTFSSTDPAQRRPANLPSALRHRLRIRTWTMTKFVFC